MDQMGRRGILKLLGSAPLAAGFALSEAQAQTAHEHVRQQARGGRAAPHTAKFFTPHEWATVRVLVDIVIPRDERSGSATDALVPEFMDFILTDPLSEPRQREQNQVQMRGGLAWLDRECGRRFGGRTFLEADETQRKAVLDDIAYPPKTDAEAERTAGYDDVAYPDKTEVMAEPTPPPGAPAREAAEPRPPVGRFTHGIAFFNAFRDLTASGFWSSKMGVQDLQYIGNTFVAEWKGCPPEVLAKLGLTGAQQS
jgi:gluconate 2-dehydrogenase gamma chain